MDFLEKLQERTKNRILSLKKDISNSDYLIFATDEIATIRYDTCKSCEYYKPARDKCDLCGCVMRYKTKASIFHCPINKW